MDIIGIKERVLKISKDIYDLKLVAATSGNVSEYSSKDGLMAITPSGINYSSMTSDDIMVIDLDGNIKAGLHKPSSEWRMHAAIYKNKPEITGVVHTHSPYATSFAVLKKEIPMILIEMIPFIGGNIKVADYARPGTDDVGMNALKVLEGRSACLLENHGALAIGNTLEKALKTAIYLEDAAKIYHLAASIGEPRTVPGV